MLVKKVKLTEIGEIISYPKKENGNIVKTFARIPSPLCYSTKRWITSTSKRIRKVSCTSSATRVRRRPRRARSATMPSSV